MSGGRYVAAPEYWRHWTSSPHEAVQRGIDQGEYPPGVKVVAWAEAGGGLGQPDHQWVGLRFPSAVAAGAWIAESVAASEADDEESFVQRFATKRELNEHLDDASTSAFLSA